MLFRLSFLFKRDRPCLSPVSMVLPSPRAHVVLVANTKVTPDRSHANVPNINFHRASWHYSATLMRVFRAFSSVVRQKPGYNSQRRGTARTLPKLFVLFCVLFVLCRSVYCLCKCVLYYCHRVAIQLWFNKYISYHIISCHISYIMSYHIYHNIYIMSCHVTSRHVTSHHITSYIMSCHVTSHHITSRHVTSGHVMSRHVTSSHVMSRHITSHHITSYHMYHIISYHNFEIFAKTVHTTRSNRQHNFSLQTQKSAQTLNFFPFVAYSQQFSHNTITLFISPKSTLFPAYTFTRRTRGHCLVTFT
jgi:hypothetical protein